jgi:ATP-binding cassette, subfamily B, bacterial MsbA
MQMCGPTMFSWIPSEIRWLLRQVRPFLRLHVGSFLCMSIGSFLALLSPLVLKWMIDFVLPARRMGLLVAAVALMLLCHQGRAVLTIGGSYLTMLAAQQLALALRLRILRHLDTLSANYHEGTPVGASMYPLKEPIDEISFLGSDLVPALLRTLLAAILTLGTMLILDPWMTLAILPLIPLFLLTRNHFRNRLERDSSSVQQNQLAWNSFLQEHLASIVAIQLLCRERRQERMAFRLLGATVRSVHKVFRTGMSFSSYTSLIIGLAMSTAIGYGGWSVFSGRLTVGGLVAFYTYMAQIFEPLSGMTETYARAQRTFASIRLVQAVLALEPAITNSRNSIMFPQSHPWTIELANVCFGYPQRDGLLYIPHLKIRGGEHIGIVGENGAGKSTMAKLIARLYDVDSGAISVAGQDIREIQIESLREQVCYVPAEPALFDTTLSYNLRLGKEAASEAELKEAAGYVGLATWAGSLQEGLNQRIGPGGRQLSSGQRQRLGIGRAILQRPRILILDEATSSLDASSEQQLLGNLQRILPGSTIIVISHRLSALCCVNRVIVLKAGRVVEDDVPAALLWNGGFYSRLFSGGASRCGLPSDP